MHPLSRSFDSSDLICQRSCISRLATSYIFHCFTLKHSDVHPLCLPGRGKKGRDAQRSSSSEWMDTYNVH